MAVDKVMRYAMIRRAAMKVQKSSKVRKSNLLLAKEVEALDRGDYKSNISWHDTDRYVNAHFNDVYKATNNEEWN